jgi:branched-subunit amino acid ABC-type transport system permease component
MSQHLQYLLLGLGGGAVIAALALGVLLTYRASGVVNFAHAAMGMFLAYTYFALRQHGELLNPLIIGPDKIRLLPGPTSEPGQQILYRFSPGTALAITMALAALYGLIVYWLVFRPLREAPTLARVAASLGLFLYLLAIAKMRLGAQGATVARPDALLPDDVVAVFGIQIQQDRLWLAGFVVVVTAALALVYHRSRFGLATRAAAESEKGAVLIGLSPTRLAAVNWMLATMLAGLAVILIAPIANINPGTTSLLIVPALAAALLGRFRSFTITAAAGVGIGMVQSEILNLRSQWGWLPDLDLQQALPFLIIIVTMAVRGESLPTRASLREGRFPRSPRPQHLTMWTLGLGSLAVVAMLTLGSNWRQGVIVTTTTALIALSVVLLTGYVGQISLMPMALAGIASFAMVKLSVDFGVPFPIAPLLAALVAVGVGLVAGLPAVRVRGMNLAIATLAAAVAIEELVLKWGWFAGGRGGTIVPPPTLGPIDLGVSAAGADFPRRAFGILCIVVLAVCALAVANLRRSPTGLRFLAVRANERAAASAGVDVTRTKLVAFAVSSFLAGLGGCLYAYGHPNLSADSFVVFQSLALLAITYLGGIAAVGGALLAGVFADGGVLSAAMGSGASDVQFAVNGLVLMVVAVVYPEGITGALYALARRLRRGGRTGSTSADGGAARTAGEMPAPSSATVG